MRIYFEIITKFHPDPVWNDGALRFLEADKNSWLSLASVHEALQSLVR